jgi:1,4-dihydroxy-2-naphthoyl-CoA hydrolase
VDRASELNEDMLPFAKLLGMRFLAADADRVLAELIVREELCTRPAVMHGGALMAFADTLGAAGTILNLPAGARTTTIESKTNFLAAAPVGSRLLGETTPLHRGRTTMVWQTRIATDAGRLVALATQTQLVLPPKA